LYPVYASDVSFKPEYSADLYSQNYTETITIDNNTYQFDYYYHGTQRCIRISGDNYSTVVIGYDMVSGKLYKNDILISSSEPRSYGQSALLNPESESDWIYLTTNQGTIDLTPLNDYLQLASAIANAIGFVYPATIITEIGANVLQFIVNFYSGCYYNGEIYRMIASPTNFKCIHYIRAGGVEYGTYTNYYNSNYMIAVPEES
jgi:hypothetical protein